VGLLLASAATLEGTEEVKQEDLGLEDLNSTPEHQMVYLPEYFMGVRIQGTDHLDKTKEDFLDKEVATHLALDHHMDLMEDFQEIKEAQVLEVVANPLDLVEESIHLKDSFHQLLVDLVLVVKDLVDTKEAQEDLIVEEVYQGTVLVKLDLEAKTLDNMEDLGHMDQEASLDLMVTALVVDLAHKDQEAFLDLMVTALVVDHHLQELVDHSMERVVNILEVQQD